MLRQFRVGVVQLKVGLDKATNLLRVREKTLEAAKNGAKLVVLPEFFNSPYGMDTIEEYAEEIPNGPSVKVLMNAARESNCAIVGGSMPERSKGKFYNTSAVVNSDGEILGCHRKVHLFDIDIPGKITFKESEKLSAGDSLTTIDTGTFGKIGLGICYDLRFPELAMSCCRQQGARLMIYPGAFSAVTGPLHWSLLLRARAVDEQVFVIGCSSARNDSGYQAYGHSMIVDPLGNILAEADETEQIIYADINFDVLDEARGQIPVTYQKRPDVYTSGGQ